MNEISEIRWPFMYDKFRYDFIRTRYFEFSKVVLFYDNLNDLERKHVEAIANFVDCETILVPEQSLLGRNERRRKNNQLLLKFSPTSISRMA